VLADSGSAIFELVVIRSQPDLLALASIASACRMLTASANAAGPNTRRALPSQYRIIGRTTGATTSPRRTARAAATTAWEMCGLPAGNKIHRTGPVRGRLL
jgi:hypothetical protein